MKVTGTRLPGVLVIEPRIFGDDRGWFVETYNADRYTEAGVRETFVQDNASFSQRGVLRGLHLQHPCGQGKLVSVMHGSVFDVAVDVRVGSPTFGRWVGVMLDAEKKTQLFIPTGFAHGFCVLSETVLFVYKCTDTYSPENEITVLWNDPGIGIEWPVEHPELSGKDAEGKALAAIPPDRLPKFDPATST